MADLFDTFGANNEQVGNVIIILQLAKIKCWLGDTSLCPTMSGSKVYINADLPEVMSFRKRYQERCSYKGSDLEVTSFNPTKTYVDVDKFLKGAVRMNVGDIHDTTNETTIVIYAKIHMIYKEFGWSYPVCKQCGRIAKENDSLHSWRCDRHGVMTSIVERYKLVVRVIDDTGSTSLILSDNMVRKLVNIPCDILKDQYVDAIDDVFPKELDAIVGKKLLFRFFYSLYNMNTDDHVYQVKMISDDKCIIKKFKEYYDRVEKDEDNFEEEPSMNNDDMRAHHVSFKDFEKNHDTELHSSSTSSFGYKKESNGDTNRGSGLKANGNVKRPRGTPRKEVNPQLVPPRMPVGRKRKNSKLASIDRSVLYKSIENVINEDISLNQTNNVVEMPSTIAIDNLQFTNEGITENNELQDHNDDMEFEYNDYVTGISKVNVVAQLKKKKNFLYVVVKEKLNFQLQ
ncbi:replication protein A 70 kDa DNA-binding subunit B [Artemisia annua]|uniref:Replication protein A 70 kDa DNA-binding subunit B n=1 Tax=Artemisia annua TaxID=35608 RepID=A0A2U1NBC7_ARTAN|nr:replication protein A 70 kDa DNA-binding subunit B [Artemisia annua]